MAGLVREGLVHAGLAVPPGIADRAQRTMTSALRNTGEALRLQALLEKAGIEPLFLKGSALAVRAYGSIAVRDSVDIDMVVAPGDVARAWDVLDEAGYVMTAPAWPLPPGALRTYQAISKDSAHHHRQRKVRLELHWRLSDAARATPACRRRATSAWSRSPAPAPSGRSPTLPCSPISACTARAMPGPG